MGAVFLYFLKCFQSLSLGVSIRVLHLGLAFYD